MNRIRALLSARLFVAASALVACLGTARAALAGTTYTFEPNAMGCVMAGSTRLWSNGNCWQPVGTPGMGDTAIVSLDPSSTGVDLEADGVTVTTLQLSGTDDGALTGSGLTIAAGGSLEWGVGGVIGEPVTVPAGATLTLNASGGDVTLTNATLTLQGTTTWTSGSLSTIGTAVIQNQGTMTIAAGSPTMGTVQDVADFYNSGTLTITGPGTFADSKGAWGFHNSGTLALAGGAVFQWLGSGNTTHTLDGGGQVTGSGTLRFADPNAIVSVVLTGQTVGAGVTLDLGQGCALSGNGAIGGAGNVVLDGCQVTVADTKTVTFSTPVSIPPVPVPDGGAPVVNQLQTTGSGILSFAGATTWSGGLVDIQAGTVTNAGTWTTTAAGVLQESASSCAFANTGTFAVDPGAGAIVEADPIVTSSGNIDVKSGTFYVVFNTLTQTAGAISLSGGTLVGNTAPPPGVPGDLTTIDIQGGSLTGAGTVNAIVTNEGAVAPGGAGSAGTLTIDGTYTQSAQGTLAIALGGTQAGTEFDVLAVGGAVTLAGTLDVSRLGGYTPSVGSSYKVLTSAASSADTGMFATVAQPAGVTLTTTYDANDVVLGVAAVSMPDAGPEGGADGGAPDASPDATPDSGSAEDSGTNLDATAPAADGGAGSTGSSSGCSAGDAPGGPDGSALAALAACFALVLSARRRRSSGQT